MISLFGMILRKAFVKRAIACGILPVVPVMLYPLHNCHKRQVGTARLSKACAPSETEAVRTLQNHNLPREQGTDLVVQTVIFEDSVKDPAYTFHTNDEVLATLGDTVSSGLYV